MLPAIRRVRWQVPSEQPRMALSWRPRLDLTERVRPCGYNCVREVRTMSEAGMVRQVRVAPDRSVKVIEGHECPECGVARFWTSSPV